MSLLPASFINNLHLQFDEKIVADLCKCIEQGNAPTAIRLNPNKPNCSFEVAEKIDWAKGAFYLKERPNFAHDPFFHAGGYYVQEASSMLIAKAIEQYMDGTGVKALDLCAAPGGKSTLLASLLPDDGFLVANEIIRSRYPVLKENLMKWGQANVALLNEDPQNLAYLNNTFDWVLVDAPCSGEGLFRKSHKAINHWTEDNVKLCAARQKRILHNAVNLVQTGGYLLYSTCTYNPFENIENVNWLIDEYGFEAMPVDNLENNGIIKIESCRGVGFQALPSRIKGEGFFMALLKKTGTNDLKELRNKTKKNKKGKQNELGLQKVKHEFLPFKIPDGFDLYEKADNLHLIPNTHLEFVSKLKNVEFFEIGKMLKAKFIPSHFLSQCSLFETDYNTIELDKKQALLYLAKQPINDIEISSLKGDLLFSYQKQALGFAKALQNRYNNNYPKEYRLRKL